MTTMDPHKAWAWANLAQDPPGNLFGPSYWATLGRVAGTNVASRGAHVIVEQLGGTRWPEFMGASPFAMTFALAKAVLRGQDVSSLNVLLTVERPLRDAFVAAAQDALRQPPGPNPSLESAHV